MSAIVRAKSALRNTVRSIRGERSRTGKPVDAVKLRWVHLGWEDRMHNCPYCGRKTARLIECGKCLGIT